MLRNLELTLAILKPDICRNPYIVQEVRQQILENRFFFVKSRNTCLSNLEAEKFYEEHKRKFFFNRLVTFMSSGSISVHVLAREDAIKRWRDMMGPTRVFKALYEEPNSLRGRFGLSDTRNATHGSDSPASALREINFFFPDLDVNQWIKANSHQYQNDRIGLPQEEDLVTLEKISVEKLWR